MNTIRVLVDGYFVDRSYGFGRYVRELIHALDRHAEGIDLVVLVPPRGHEIAVEIAKRGHIVVERQRFFPVWEQLVVPRAARKLGCDIVHFPYQSMALMWPHTASVVTVHDLVPFGPENVRNWSLARLATRYQRVMMTLLGARVAQIVAVSRATAKELRRIRHLDSVVVPNTVEGFVSRYRDVAADLPKAPYFLHRGGVGRHKNTSRVVDAFLQVRELYPEVRLKVFGLPLDPDKSQHYEKVGVDVVGMVRDVELAWLYKSALAVVMPSTEEGFGLAIVEAFGFGTPVITSNRPPMSEVASESSAILVTPESVDMIAEAMLDILRNSDLRTTLRSAGLARASQYGSAKVAEALSEIYKDVSKGLGLAAPSDAGRSLPMRKIS